MEKLTAFKAGFNQTPADRQKLLDPTNTEVYSPPDFKVPFSEEVGDGHTVFHPKEALRRGWSEVHWDSYGESLVFFEQYLNNRFKTNLNSEMLDKYKKEWKILQGKFENEDDNIFSKDFWNFEEIIKNFITKDEFSKLGECYLPVHAAGYNWTKSNKDSAKEIEEKINKIIDHYEKENQYFEMNSEKKVIILTHSMGGLVARYYAKKDSSKILGMIHGVQPVNGAPVVYRRMRDGTEVEDFDSGSIPIFRGFVHLFNLLIAGGTSVVLGSSSADITAVMANSPGCLELLPNKKYGNSWLKVRYEDLTKPTFNREHWVDRYGRDQWYGITVVDGYPIYDCFSLPEKGDPYQEIYSVRVQDKWWGMIDEDLIDPANLHPKIKGKTSGPIFEYMRNLKKASDFHEELGDYFFDNTHAHYGDFQTQPGYGEIIWLSSGKSLKEDQCPGLRDSNLGLKFELQHRDPDEEGNGWGDSTVPNLSAKALPKKVKVFPFRASKKESGKKESFDHQFSYKHPGVRLSVLWSITKFIQLVKKDLS